MISYLRNNEINKQRWDKCIESSPQGIVYAFSWYLDVVSPGWDALVEDDYKSVFPLTFRKKAGIKYLYQPYFTQQLGLFSEEKIISGELLAEFIEAIPRQFRLIEIQLNDSNSTDVLKDFEIQKRRTHHLDLSKSYDQISDNYSENTRRNIKKFVKAQFDISVEVNPVEVVELFRKNRGSEISNLKQVDYDRLLVLCSAAGGRDLADCRGIYNASGNLIAGSIFLKSVHSYIFLFSASNDEAKETGAMSALIDSFIKDHSGSDLYLDFEGSMDENLSRFYKSFGSKEVVYLQIRKNKLPYLIRWLK